MANKPIPATCDAGCRKTFTVNKFKIRLVKKGIEKTYFKCPHCKHEYIAFYSSKDTKKLQQEMRQLHRNVYGKGTEMDMKEFYQREQELKSKIKQSMDEARRIVEG